LGATHTRGWLQQNAFGLVRYTTVGVDPEGSLGEARPRMLLFDAFLAAMGFNGATTRGGGPAHVFRAGRPDVV